MVRVKNGANNFEADETQKILTGLMNGMLALRRLQIEESNRHEESMKAIRNDIETMCVRIDEYSKQYAKKNKPNRQRDRQSIARRSISTLAPRTKATPASNIITNQVSIRETKELTTKTKVNQAIIPAPSRVLRNRAEIRRKAEQPRSVRQLVQFEQDETTGRKSVRQMSSYSSSTRTVSTSYRQDITAICTPCTIPLRDCDRRLRKKKA